MSDKRVSEMTDNEIGALARASDPLTATLAGIRDEAQSSIAYADNHACPDITNSCSEHNTLRLLAAVDAVLNFHDEGVIYGSPEPFHYCRTCSGHPAWPCPEVRAITRKLTGEGGGNGAT